MKSEALYPECSECGAREGIATAIVGPASTEDMHDIEKYELACGHEIRPEAQISSGIVQMLQIQDPDTIEVRSGIAGKGNQ